MNLLAAQSTLDVTNEGTLLVIGLIACIGVFALLLAKKEVKNIA